VWLCLFRLVVLPFLNTLVWWIRWPYFLLTVLELWLIWSLCGSLRPCGVRWSRLVIEYLLKKKLD